MGNTCGNTFYCCGNDNFDVTDGTGVSRHLLRYTTLRNTFA